MNPTVFQIDPADSRFTDTFARFFTDCGEYELFSDCDTPYFAVNVSPLTPVGVNDVSC